MNNFSKEILTKTLQSSKEDISYIIYVANLSEESIYYKDIDIVSKTVFTILTNISENNLNLYESMLQQIKDECITINNYKINIRTNSLFPLILLNSLRHCNLNRDDTFKDPVALRSTVLQLIKFLCPFKWSTTFLLKTLHYILMKRHDIFTSTLCWNILEVMNVMALSPISGFKSYVHSVTKLIISLLTSEQSQSLCQIDLLPIRGIETIDLVKLLPQDFIYQHNKYMLQKICKMFENNVDGKVGACLYQKLVSCYQFDKWVENVWPHFFKYLEAIDCGSEFYQSFIKYWININVNEYHGDFYLFLKDKPIDFQLKSYVLLESRKRGYILNSYDHILEIFNNMDTANMGIKIVSTYYKKSICPLDCDKKLFMDFLYSNIIMFLDDDQLKSIKMFLSQFFLFAHCDLRKNRDRFRCYSDFVKKIYKYCYVCLNTEMFEVGCQVLHCLLDIVKGSSSDLTLTYKLDKIDVYNKGKNKLFIELVSNKLWVFDTGFMTLNISHCFKRTQGSNKVLTNLIIKHYLREDIIDVVDVEKIIADIESSATLQNIEKVINYSQILFKNELIDNRHNFTLKIYEILLNNLKNLSCIYSEKDLYKTTLYLGIFTTAMASNMEAELLNTVLTTSLNVIHLIMNNKFAENYNPSKVVETFINNVIHSYTRNINILWHTIEKEYILNVLIDIIQKSNMKKCVTTSADALKCIGVLMEESEYGQSLKIKLLSKTLAKINVSPLKQLKIRRNPETRLIIHAMCASEKNPTKPLLKWVLNFLINVMSDKYASDLSISASLHCMEILVSDNNLQSTAFLYLPEIIKCSVEVFIRPSWIVRNADLQLIKALIERIYGVSLGTYNRPKNIENIFLLVPQLMRYFFEILSMDQLDERSTIVFQYFIESQVKENIFNKDIVQVLDCFQRLFVDIIKTYPNHFGKFSALAYVSVCRVESMQDVFEDVVEFLIKNFYSIQKNIVANLVLLLKELYEKYQTSLKIGVNTISSTNIDKILQNLVIFLRATDTELFNFLLIKVESLDTVLAKIEIMKLDNDFQQRLWLHNNAVSLINSTRSCALSNVLSTCFLSKIPSFIHIKLLNTLVSRFEKDEIESQHLNKIINILFKCSVVIENQDNYLLKHYFRTILLFVQNCTNLELENIDLTLTKNVHKTMIFVMYCNFKKLDKGNVEVENFCKSAKKQIFKSISISEELDNDIISIIYYFIQISSAEERLNLYKLLFYYSLFCSTYEGAYNCILKITDKKSCNILTALNDFLIFINKDMTMFIKDILKTVYESDDNIQSECFYEIENDILIPYTVVRKLQSSFHQCRNIYK